MRTYSVTTFGCQMNVHDSERIKGLLESSGLGEAVSSDEADVLVFNTCTIREKADERLIQHLMNARGAKLRDPDKLIVVGGCWSESMKDSLFEEFPFVDFAFGPGNIHRLGEYITAGGAFPRGHFSTFDNFAGSLPLKRDREHQAWLQISTGCNCNCAYCIVPSVRGRERSRHPDELVAEATALAADGVIELTLLGQNVNAYGRDLRPQVATNFAQLLRDLDAVEGIGRIRYTSPHPKDMRADVIAAMAECDAVCEQLHLPVQSGSTRVLKAMRRTYSRERYLQVVADVRAAIPEIALTTDIIVGFPGETDAEFEDTLSLYDEVGLRPRIHVRVLSPARHRGCQDGGPGARTGQEGADPAAGGPGADHAARRNRELEGTVQEVLVEGPSRTDPAVLRGRSAETRRSTSTAPEAPVRWWR